MYARIQQSSRWTNHLLTRHQRPQSLIHPSLYTYSYPSIQTTNPRRIHSLCQLIKKTSIHPLIHPFILTAIHLSKQPIQEESTHYVNQLSKTCSTHRRGISRSCWSCKDQSSHGDPETFLPCETRPPSAWWGRVRWRGSCESVNASAPITAGRGGAQGRTCRGKWG